METIGSSPIAMPGIGVHVGDSADPSPRMIRPGVCDPTSTVDEVGRGSTAIDPTAAPPEGGKPGVPYGTWKSLTPVDGHFRRNRPAPMMK